MRIMQFIRLAIYIGLLTYIWIDLWQISKITAFIITIHTIILEFQGAINYYNLKSIRLLKESHINICELTMRNLGYSDKELDKIKKEAHQKYVKENK